MPHSTLISPHGAEQLNPLYVADTSERQRLEQEAASLPSITIALPLQAMQ